MQNKTVILPADTNGRRARVSRLSATHQHHREHHELVLHGVLDYRNVQHVESVVRALHHRWNRPLVIDIRDVTSMDSIGLLLLVTLAISLYEDLGATVRLRCSEDAAGRIARLEVDLDQAV